MTHGPDPAPSSSSGAFTIIRATPSHLDLAREAMTEVHGRRSVQDSALKEFLEDARCYLLLAVEEDRAVGSLNGYFLPRPYRSEPQFLLYEIDVREDCRRRGIGRALVERFHAEAKLAGAYEVWVLTDESNRAGMGLYERARMARAPGETVMWERSLEEEDPVER